MSDILANVAIDCVDHKGRRFHSFFVAKATESPGWFVFGRHNDYSNCLVYLCGRPNVAATSHPKYNGKVRKGWKLRRDAETVADEMNRRGI